MKHLLTITALLSAVLMFSACNPDPVEIERDITYTVDTQTTTVHLKTDAEFDALLDRFCNYAESGSTVTFYNSGLQAAGSTKGAKEAVTYSTTSRQDMKQWMRRMEAEGKTVTVTYDSGTGTYNGMAYANAPNPQNSYWVDLGLPSGVHWAM